MEKKDIKSNKKKGSATERKTFSFEFNKVKFPSQALDTFRTSVNSATDGVVLWVESKKSKQQWQATITKMEEAGPAGVPEGAVIAFLKVSRNYQLFGTFRNKLFIIMFTISIGMFYA